MSDARTIETAPKDGRNILLFGDARIVGYPVSESEWEGDWHKGYWDGERWASDTEGEIIRPTHWLEMPAKPQIRK